MCGDVSRWAVRPCLFVRVVCEWSVCLQNIYISRFTLRLALALSNTHTRHTQGGYGLPSPLTRKEAAAWPACPHRSALTRSHTADTSRISSLGLAPPLSIRTRHTQRGCGLPKPLAAHTLILHFHFTHFLSLCLQIQRAGAQRKTGSSSLFSTSLAMDWDRHRADDLCWVEHRAA